MDGLDESGLPSGGQQFAAQALYVDGASISAQVIPHRGVDAAARDVRLGGQVK